MRELEQVLVISLNNSYYGIITDDIEHILRVPQITKVPLTPKSIVGICPLEGKITSVYDCKYLIDSTVGFVDRENFKSRLLTIRGQKNFFAILVDEVLDNISPKIENIEECEHYDEDAISHIIKDSDKIIQVIDIKNLTKSIEIPKYVTSEIKEHNSGKSLLTHISTENSTRMLFFKMGKESYALDIELIREIIFQPSKVTPIANVSKDIIGMITLRTHVLVAIDLRAVFNMDTATSDKNRIIIIHHGKKAAGLLVDEILDIRDVENSLIDKIPEHFDDEKISGVVKNNKELVSIIHHKVLEELVEKADSGLKSEANEKLPNKEELSQERVLMELVIFSLNGKEYAFDIEDVEEIIRYSEITKIPEAPHFLKGIINLRGGIIPIVSLHQRLKEVEKIDEDTKILVCRIQGKKMGFLVDNVSEVLDVTGENIQKNDSQNAIFSDVILLKNGKRVILKISSSKLFSENEIKNMMASAK